MSKQALLNHMVKMHARNYKVEEYPERDWIHHHFLDHNFTLYYRDLGTPEQKLHIIKGHK